MGGGWDVVKGFEVFEGSDDVFFVVDFEELRGVGAGVAVSDDDVAVGEDG